MDIGSLMLNMARDAREAGRRLAGAAPEAKNLFLEKLDSLLEKNEKELLAVNAAEVSAARQAGLDEGRLDRLALTPAITRQMRAACRHVASLPDPIGATETQWQRPNGLLVGKMRVPLGVVGIIYEARPNVTIDAAILCVKAGNAAILRSGGECMATAAFLGGLCGQALAAAGLPEKAVQVVGIGGHEAVEALCRLDEYIDVMIPRGGEKLIRAVCAAATMPVLRHYKGVCHAYVDKGADIDQACAIVENAKTQRPGVCNALECVLAHRDAAASFLPALAQKLAPHNVEFRACPAALPLLGPRAVPLRGDDLGREFGAPILVVTIVENMDEAMRHIEIYGSRHTDIICTRDYNHAMRFLREVDASMVAVNASTRFNDGGELGLGAEIGISTTKLHAYGPMGVNELTTTKFVVLGNGQTRI